MRGILAAYGLPGMVLWIWIISSTVEEVFCRGWFQSLVAGADGSDSHGERTGAAVMWSAALFGAMHLPLLLADVEIAGVVVIVLSVTALGASARRRAPGRAASVPPSPRTCCSTSVGFSRA